MKYQFSYDYFTDSACEKDGNVMLDSVEKRINDAAKSLTSNEDYIEFEDGKKCFTVHELEEAISLHSASTPKNETVYYQGVIEDTTCKLTSKIWYFDNLMIPVNSISTVAAYKKDITKVTTVIAIIFVCIGLFGDIKCLITFHKFSFFGTLIYGIIAAIIFLIGKLTKWEGIQVTSNSGGKTKVVKSHHKIQDKIQPLLQAAIKCLTESK